MIKFSRELNHKNTCHPPVTLDTLKKRVHPLCLSAFCHPDTLKHEKLHIANIPWKYLFPNLLPFELFFVSLQTENN